MLDLGCGFGLRLLVFRQYGFDVHGVDFQAGAVEYLRQRWGIPAVCANVARLAEHTPPSSFDVVTAFHLLEHVADVGSVLRSCFQVLRPGGWLVAAVPLVDSGQATVFKSRWIGATEAPRHVTIPSQRGISRACRLAGFAEPFVRPDVTLNCAGFVGLTLLPRAATSRVYGRQTGRSPVPAGRHGRGPPGRALVRARQPRATQARLRNGLRAEAG